MSADELLIVSLVSQLTLNVHLRDDATFASYHEGPNAHVVRYLRAFASQNSTSLLVRQAYLCGAASTGKSHLLQALCTETSRQGGTSIYLPVRQFSGTHAATALEDLDQTDLVCFDDLDALAGKRDWEIALFNLINNIQASGSALVMAARSRPKDIAIQIPDLASRLLSGPVFQLKRLSDTNKIKALQVYATQRGVVLRDDAARYLLNHYPRNLKQLIAALERLDKVSLATKRRITIPFIKAVL